MKKTTLEDLVEKVKKEKAPRMLWNGIPEGSSGLITGVAKTGKTTLAENLAISLSCGLDELLGHKINVDPQKVLFINFEESYKLRIRRNIKQLEKLNDEQVRLVNKNFYSTPIEFPEFLNNEEDWKIVSDYIEDINPDIIFMDSLTRMCVGEIERSSVAQNFSQMFNKYIRALDKTVIVVHHNVKGNEKPISQETISGSRVISQEFEYAIGLAKIPSNAGGNYCSVVYNKHIPEELMSVTYTIDGFGWLNSGNKVYASDLYKNSNIDYRKGSQNKEKIAEYLKSRSSQGCQTFTTQALKHKFVESSTSTMTKDTFHNNLNKLVDEGFINKFKRGEYTISNQ